MLTDISRQLLSVCDQVEVELEQLRSKNTINEFTRNGKKYRLTSNGDFVRVHDESKHLTVSSTYQGLKNNYSVLSAYRILSECGNFLSEYRQLALAIIFTARELELKKWYDETSKVIVVDNVNDLRNPNFSDVEADAFAYIADVDTVQLGELVRLGASIITATKINYFQTDHNVTTPSLEGYALRKLITDAGGVDALRSVDVYNALRAFSHWCSIRGVFYIIGLPNLKIDPVLMKQFNSFPVVPDWVIKSVHARYPAGCSRVALIKKVLILLGNSLYGRLIAAPHPLNAGSVLKLCANIETDPLTYRLCASPNSNYSTRAHIDVSKKCPHSSKWLEFLSAVLHAIGTHRMPENKLTTSNKILKLPKVKGMKAYKDTCDLVRRVRAVERSNGRKVSDNQIISIMGGEVKNSIASHVLT
ncbi:hypothetical protein CANINC_001225 [Pichia inconspicua]|uniref:Uncharacterized protein n=1 Tax=Pichia inconspicua TaxID=52247 RepID=A0A4T0X479_9ASCO|nr:hypothetical protein CANINC_001225 [[Candida] inconspicua]